MCAVAPSVVAAIPQQCSRVPDRENPKQIFAWHACVLQDMAYKMVVPAKKLKFTWLSNCFTAAILIVRVEVVSVLCPPFRPLVTVPASRTCLVVARMQMHQCTNVCMHMHARMHTCTHARIHACMQGNRFQGTWKNLGQMGTSFLKVAGPHKFNPAEPQRVLENA